MKKQLLIIGITVLLIAVGLSGCTDSNGGFSTTLPDGTVISGDIDKVEISNLEIITQTRETMSADWEKLGDGFLKTVVSEGYGREQYLITATAEIISDEMFDDIEFTAKFYDIGNNQIDDEKTFAHGLPSGTIWEIKFYYLNQVGNYFEDVHHIIIEISVS